LWQLIEHRYIKYLKQQHDDVRRDKYASGELGQQ
jgi:hypothetical protein